MTDSFDLDNYSIVSSLNERTIYIKVIDKITFMCYEGNIDAKELRLSIDLSDAYKLISKCFGNEDRYNVTYTINSGIMKMNFAALVEGFMKFNFEIILREKVMSNDGQLTLNFTRIEQTQKHAIHLLTQRLSKLEVLVDAVSHAEIYMLIHPYNFNSNNNKHYWKVNTTEMTLTSQYWDYSKIELFYQLEKITFQTCGDLTHFQSPKVSNKNVKEIIINNCGGLSSLLGLNGFPELEKITITTCGVLQNVTSVFSSYKHKITHIIMKACPASNNTELMTYCQKNNIKLDLS